MYIPKQAKIVGQTSLDEKGTLFASDHFGLVVDFVKKRKMKILDIEPMEWANNPNDQIRFCIKRPTSMNFWMHEYKHILHN